MFNFSFGEILVVAIVSILVIKPEDIPKVATKLREFKNYFTSLKHEFAKNLDLIAEDNTVAKLSADIEEINFYLKKILECGENYTGAYSLTEVRNYYKNIQRKKLLSFDHTSNHIK